MEVQEIFTRTVKLTKLQSLDPITVHLENYEPGKGKIGIECFGKSWSAYWGGMSGDPVEKFFVSCNADYLIGCLSPSLRSEVDDFEALEKLARKQICELRRASELTMANAAALWEEAEEIGRVETPSTLRDRHWDFMYAVFGEDWWHAIPVKPNPRYQYLKRILEAVQEGLKKVIGVSEEA